MKIWHHRFFVCTLFIFGCFFGCSSDMDDQPVKLENIQKIFWHEHNQYTVFYGKGVEVQKIQFGFG